jgi:hypothetical protein
VAKVPCGFLVKVVAHGFAFTYLNDEITLKKIRTHLKILIGFILQHFLLLNRINAPMS